MAFTKRVAAATSWMLVALSIPLGAALGAWIGWQRAGQFGAAPDDFVRVMRPEDDPRLPSLPPADGPQPVLIAEETSHDFGRMELGTKGQHTFTIRNDGGYPLILRKGDATCKCTIAGLELEEIGPGESATVTLDWDVKGEHPEFRHSATILSNDPKRRRLELEIVGLISATIDITPRAVSFTKRRDDEKKLSATIFATKGEPIEVLSHKLANSSTAEFFDVEFLPLVETDRLFGRDSGIRVQITVKPGLPLGRIRQQIVFHTNREERPELSLAIDGTIEGDVSLVGANWDRHNEVVQIGTVQNRAGETSRIFLMFRGPNRLDVDVRVAEIEPSWLQVHVGEPEPISDGRVIRVPLEIEIPQGAPSASFLGPGRGGYATIVLETGHPDAPRLPIQVRFAVSS